MEPTPPVLSYSRQPIPRDGKERLRLVRQFDGVTLVVFPSGGYEISLGRVLLLLPLVIGVMVIPIVFLLLLPAALCVFKVGAGRHPQVEFDITDDELVCITFRRRGLEDRRWPRSDVRNVRVVPPEDGQPVRLVLVWHAGYHDILIQGTTAEHLEHVARELRAALGLGQPARLASPARA